MKITIEHRQKTIGLIRKTTHHGVAINASISAHELAIIRERQLEKDVVLERGYPSDMSDAAIDRHANQGLGKRLLTAAVSGADALHFDLTIGKLMKGEDVYFLGTPIEAKEYEESVKSALVVLKNWIDGNAEVEKETATFEL